MWIASGAVYLALAGYWNVAAIRGLAHTGGTGQWSGAISDVMHHLLTHPDVPGKAVHVIDWGLQNNLFVLSDSRLKTVEEFDGDWSARVAAGGLFLANGERNTLYREPREGFLRALAESGKPVQPVRFHEKGGDVFAELWVVPAGSGNELISGFHEKAPEGWRWTQREFPVGLWTDRSSREQRVRVELFLVEAVLKTGPVTLEASVNRETIGKAVYARSGGAVFEAPLPIAPREPVRVDFRLSKALPPGPQDRRELGIIVSSVRRTGGPGH